MLALNQHTTQPLGTIPLDSRGKNKVIEATKKLAEPSLNLPVAALTIIAHTHGGICCCARTCQKHSLMSLEIKLLLHVFPSVLSPHNFHDIL